MGPRRLHTDVQRRPSASPRRFCILGHPHEARRPPDALLPDPAEQGWGRRPDNPDLLKGYEVIGVVRGHGTILLPESAPSTRGEGRSTLPPSRCGAENGLAATGTVRDARSGAPDGDDPLPEDSLRHVGEGVELLVELLG